MQLLAMLPLFHFYASPLTGNGARLLRHIEISNVSILRTSSLFAVTTGGVFVKNNDSDRKSKGMTTVCIDCCTDFTTNNDKTAYS